MSLISFDEVKRNKWLVVGDDVYDVSKFAAKHPGGDEIVQLQGSDATFPLINAHGIQGKLPKQLPKNLIRKDRSRHARAHRSGSDVSSGRS